MPVLTLAANAIGTIPGRAGRKSIVLQLKTGGAVWGWESTTTFAGSTEGMTLPASPNIVQIADTEKASAAITVAAGASGVTLKYTENL
jgi:hypothetical protein